MQITTEELKDLLDTIGETASRAFYDAKESGEATIKELQVRIQELEAERTAGECKAYEIPANPPCPELEAAQKRIAELETEVERGRRRDQTNADTIAVMQEHRQEIERELKQANSLYSEIHDLLNEVSRMVPLSGSPDYRDCLKWLLENLPQMKEDAARGRLLVMLPEGYSIMRCGENEWEVNHYENDKFVISEGKTAEEAMNNACVERTYKREHREVRKEA